MKMLNYRMLYLVITCAVLMAMSVAGSYAANVVIDGGFDSIPSGTNLTGDYPTGCTVGSWSWVSATASGGSLSAVTPGRDGTGQCIQIARTTPYGTWTAINSTFAPVVGGQTYDFSFWLKCSVADQELVAVVASFQNSDGSGYLGNTLVIVPHGQLQWTQATATYTAPTGTNYAQVQFAPVSSISTMMIDDVVLNNNIVPEPASMVAMFSGLVGFVGFAARRRKLF